MTCFKDQFTKPKPKGCSSKTQFQQNFMNMMNIRHACVQLKSKLSIHDQMSQFTQKHDEFMDYNPNMNMYVRII